MNFRYSATVIHEFVQAPKCIAEGQEINIQAHGEKGAAFKVDLALKDGAFLDLGFVGAAGVSTQPQTYETGLLLEQVRVRGIGYAAVARRNFRAKRQIPQGWHQNICNPNVPTTHADWNRHEALPGFNPTDFSHFIRLSAEKWAIDLQWEAELL